MLRDAEAVRRRTMALFQGLEELDDPQVLIDAIVDAVLIVEAYRGARHQVMRLPELTRSIDTLMKELAIIERTNQWAREEAAPI